MTKTFEEVFATLEACGSDRGRRIYARQGSGDNQFGVMMGDIRKLADQVKTNHALGMQLWATGNSDARVLATMIMSPAEPTADELDAMVRSLTYIRLLDDLVYNLIARTPHADALRERWRHDASDLVGRASWNLMVARVIAQKTADFDIDALLADIEAELRTAPTYTQESMNRCLVEIGVRMPEHRERCVAIGERLGVYVDQKVAKGCTSAYAPGWIAVAVKNAEARRAKRGASARSGEVT